MVRTRIAFSGALALTVVSLAGCSESPVSMSPAAPTTLRAPAATNAGNSATFVDRTEGYVRESGVVAAWAAERGWAMADGLAVEGTASITQATGTCPDRVITLLGVPVTANSATTYGTGINCAGLVTGTTVHVTGLLTFASGSFSVTATNISLPAGTGGGGGTPPPPGGGRRRGGEGTVANLRGTCPTLTMIVRGVRVETTSSTTFENAECGNIRVGTVVAVEGDLQDDGHLDATNVRITNQPGGGHGHFEGEGTVASLRGSCPTLTMVIRGYSVMTSSTTTFTDGACADIHPGSRVFVSGVNQANSLMAEEVKLLPAEQP